MLNYMTFGDEKSPPVMIVHGLYGSGKNWGVIAKRLSDQFFVITVDLRNHGDSPWLDTHNYHVMADDLVEVINSLNICLLYTSPSPRDAHESRMPSSA